MHTWNLVSRSRIEISRRKSWLKSKIARIRLPKSSLSSERALEESTTLKSPNSTILPTRPSESEGSRRSLTRELLRTRLFIRSWTSSLRVLHLSLTSSSFEKNTRKLSILLEAVLSHATMLSKLSSLKTVCVWL